MPNFTVVRFTQDDLAIDTITAIVRQGEATFGPLLAISPCEAFPRQRLTCFTHEVASEPDRTIDLRLCMGGVIPTVPDASVVCIGSCFIDGRLRTVAAFR